MTQPLRWDGRRVVSVEEFARALPAEREADADQAWHATLVRVGDAVEARELGALARRHHVGRVDTMDRQLADLAATRFPAPADEARRREFRAEASRDPGGRDAYGLWAWYPWLGRLVHVLPPDEFFAVITDRNRDKVTREEQARLRHKRVGVIGLSVGGEAAVTLAQEHLVGHLVLADFDRLDLSNLNRLGAGVDELGINKAVLVARRISRIDPYLAITLFPLGVTADSTQEFLDGLDLLVEECDALPLKLAIRHEARRRRLNVVYAGDERGFLSVEPYASAPLEPFHGLVSRARDRTDYPDAESFMRGLTEWLGGWDGISARSRASIPRIGRELSGYPQLASEARFAAGQLGHVARRLLLGELLAPSWQHMDLEELVPGGART